MMTEIPVLRSPSRTQTQIKFLTRQLNSNLETFWRAARTLVWPLVVLLLSSAAHAQGTISFSGAQTFMQTVETFAEYAGAVICLIGLIFAGVSFMSGNIQRGVIGLFGAIFGAGVLGWGAGWISSLTGQTVN